MRTKGEINMPLQKIGKYEIVKELGKGAMGVVYEGRDPQIGRQVAIKTIRFDAGGDELMGEEVQKRFVREAQSAGNLRHQNIVTIYDVGEDQGMMFIAMEYVDGQSLEKRIASRKKFEAAEVAALLSQVAEALDYAHRKGIIHRDIKPANILIDSDGRPRVVDFGIAHVSTSTITNTGISIGTPAYMAPEQIAGQKLDGRADVFSLGVVLYEMLTLNKPFGADNVTTIIYKIMNEDPRPMREFDKGIPAGLEFICRKALAKNPAGRYQTAREMVDDLKNYETLEIAEIPRGESPTTKFRTPTAAPVRKSKTGLFAAIGVGVVGIAAAAFFLTRKAALPANDPTMASNPKPVISDKTPAITPKTSPTSAQPGSANTAKPLPPPTDKKAAEPAVLKTEAAKTTAPKPAPIEKEKVEAPQENEPRPIRAIDAGMKAPKMAKKVEAVLPPDQRKAGISGYVILEVTTDSHGRVRDVKVLRSLQGCDQAAIDSVRQSIYEPAIVDGKPRGLIFSWTVVFEKPTKK
jgi:eukaryotic-like serine/threonine-protein kinase